MAKFGVQSILIILKPEERRDFLLREAEFYYTVKQVKQIDGGNRLQSLGKRLTDVAKALTSIGTTPFRGLGSTAPDLR